MNMAIYFLSNTYRIYITDFKNCFSSQLDVFSIIILKYILANK